MMACIDSLIESAYEHRRIIGQKVKKAGVSWNGRWNRIVKLKLTNIMNENGEQCAAAPGQTVEVCPVSEGGSMETMWRWFTVTLMLTNDD